MEPLIFHCQCGRGVRVTSGDAGASFPCPCGRTIEIPSLDVLRQLSESGAENEAAHARFPGGTRPAPAGPSVGASQLVGCGGLVCLLGFGLFVGNLTGLFPTVPFAGFIVMALGGVIAGAGSRI
jgi:hypothetical protein